MSTPASPADPDPVRCPDCGGPIARVPNGAECHACGAHYRSSDGILDLLGSKSEVNASELEVQDRVSDHYENARYRRPASLLYHEHTLEVLTRAAPPRGVVLDDGCGNGLLFGHLA